MKIAIITHADKNVKEMKSISHPLIEQYADDCGADYINMIQDCEMPHAYRILQLREYLNIYDRVLNLDSDVIINKNCPNIFDEVPFEKIGTIFEDKGTRAGDRHNRIKKAKQKFGVISWETGYINTGIFLVSNIHKEIFQPINGELWMDLGYDDVHLGYQIRKHNFDIHELDFKWNFMTMHVESWNKCADRFNSYILHYAGRGTYNSNNRVDQMRKDYNKIYE